MTSWESPINRSPPPGQHLVAALEITRKAQSWFQSYLEVPSVSEVEALEELLRLGDGDDALEFLLPTPEMNMK